MRQSAVQQIVRDSMDDVLGPAGQRTATPGQQREFSQLVAERYVRLLQHMGVFEDNEDPIAPPP